MSSPKPNEASIFNAARKIESTADRDVYLREACQGDGELRDRIAKLLVAFAAESQFLEQPATGLEATKHLDPSIQVRGSAMQVGLAAAFTVDEAILLGNGNHSVLKMFDQTLPNVPRVALRESNSERDDPIMRPKSPEMPDCQSDSRYQLQGEIARGGMGAILKGRDTDLGRDLAIKVLLETHKNKPEVVQRFIEEAQIGGQLQHPGIAPIYELGQFADKRPFFAMKLIKGKTLSVLLAERQDLAADRAKFVGIFEQVCQTMAYVHSRGVIHRDLKPANIMVGAFGEVQVMDWGLAKVLKSGGTADEKKSQQLQQGQSLVQTLRSVGSDVPGPFGSGGSETQMGSVMGTPAYMPPEQALGEIDQLDERSDVFGLGAILSEILTGKPPYTASNSTEIFRLASRGKLSDCFMRLDACGADEELIMLAKQCLELEPKDRPRDAGVLVEKVSNFIESVNARLHATELQRAAQTARAIEERKLRRMTLASAAGAILMIGLGCGGWMWRASEQAERRAVVTAKVNSALNDAILHRSLADAADDSKSNQVLPGIVAQGNRLKELEKAVEAAKRAVDHSKELDTNVELRENATSLLAELNEQTNMVAKLVEQTRRDRAFQEELEEIRLSYGEGGEEDRYQELFRDAGLDLTVFETEEAVRRIQESRIGESLIVAIDNWARRIATPSSGALFDAAIKIQNWELATRAGQELLVSNPDQSLVWLRVAAVLLLAGENEAYRECCARMFLKFGTRPDLGSREAEHLCRAFVLSRESLDLSQLPVSTFVDPLVDETRRERYRAWRWATRGLLAYRGGDAVTADQHFEEALRLSPEDGKELHRYALAIIFAGMALTKNQLGQVDEAREALERANRLVEELLKNHSDKAQHDTLIAKVLVREAQSILKSKSDLSTNPSAVDEPVSEVVPSLVRQSLLKQRLLDIANGADRSPWRKSLRTAMGNRDSSGLRLLANADQVHDERVELIAMLGSALQDCGEIELSITLLQKAMQRHPGDLWINFELCSSLQEKGENLESLGYARATVALRPNSPRSHLHLSVALAGIGRQNEAIFEVRKHLELGKDYADGRIHLGNLLGDNNQDDEAIAEYRRAIELDPKHPIAHYSLGNALGRKDQVDEAHAEYRKAIDCDQNFAAPHINLGADMHRKGLVDEAMGEYRNAIAKYRKGISDDKEFAMAHSNLGYALKSKDQLEEAIAEYKKAIELDPKYAAAQKGLTAALSAAKLPAFIKGEFEPRDNSERLGLATACYDKKLYHSAVGLYIAAFEADAKLGDDRQVQHGYSAACNAVLATTAQCEDSIQLDEADRIRLRQKALDWLKAELERWRATLDSGSTDARQVATKLRHWQKDTDLANIRDTEALTKLPAKEQTAFNQLWSDVATLLKKEESPAAKVTKP